MDFQFQSQDTQPVGLLFEIWPHEAQSWEEKLPVILSSLVMTDNVKHMKNHRHYQGIDWF